MVNFLRSALCFSFRRILAISLVSIFLVPIYAISMEFPAAGWHRGDVSVGQENSRKAIVAALKSQSPNIEVDILDFVNEEKKRIGLVAHDYTMDRITGSKGKFIDYNDISKLPKNSANSTLSPEPFLSIIDLFEIIKQAKSEGIIPLVSLDMKEEGDKGEEFGVWVGEKIKEYGFQDHVFASSFYKSNVVGVEKSCPECMTGGLVFNDHWALKNLNHHYSSLDISGLGKMTFFLGFLGKKEFPHDFILIQDDILFAEPELVQYWKNVRKVNFVGVYVYKKDRSYTAEEWEILKTVDWLEIDTVQMEQFLGRTKE